MFAQDGYFSRKGKFTIWGYLWPQRSPELNTCYYFLWGYLKSHVHFHKPHTLNEPNEAIGDKHWLQSMMTRELANFI